MKAVICNSFGPIDSLSLENVEGFKSNEEEVEVEIKAAALNFPDVLMVEGKYQSLPKFPFSPGGEFAGIITKESNSDSRFKVGDAVFGAKGHGCLAEKIALSPDKLRHKPEHMSFEIAAGLSTTYGTSYYALKQRGNLAKGETLLVLGAAGGVGLAAVQLGKAMGARVIAAASSGSGSTSTSFCTGTSSQPQQRGCRVGIIIIIIIAVIPAVVGKGASVIRVRHGRNDRWRWECCGQQSRRCCIIFRFGRRLAFAAAATCTTNSRNRNSNSNRGGSTGGGLLR